MVAPDSTFANLLPSGDRDTSAVDQLVPHVYDELREVAHRHLASDRPGHTLSTTELVHEAYIRLADSEAVTDRGRAYFFAAAARAMRQILVDYARRRSRLKRGGGRAALTLDEALVSDDNDPLDVVDLDRALQQLQSIASRPAEVVECRFFGGLTVEDTALALGVTTRTVKRDWAFARAWLFEHLESGHAPDE